MAQDEKSKSLVPQPHGGAIHQGRPPGYKNPTAGRPTALTPDLQKIITDTIRQGNYAHVAAAAAGITEKTFYEWLQRGDRGEEPFREFSEQVLISASEAEKNMTDVLRAAATGTVEGDWKAGAWWLERRFPKRWGRQQRRAIGRNPWGCKCQFDNPKGYRKRISYPDPEAPRLCGHPLQYPIGLPFCRER